MAAGTRKVQARSRNRPKDSHSLGGVLDQRVLPGMPCPSLDTMPGVGPSLYTRAKTLRHSSLARLCLLIVDFSSLLLQRARAKFY